MKKAYFYKINLAVAALLLTGCIIQDNPIALTSQADAFATKTLPAHINAGEWYLSWQDEFDYPDSHFDKNWVSQNSKTENPYVISSRWRENVVIEDGLLKLLARKESRGGQDWTSGSIWSKKQFKYGYYEARYKYAGAAGTNNSFWLWPEYGVEQGMKECELDINEGHFPNEINTNVHNWTDTWENEHGNTVHKDSSKTLALGGQLDHSVTLKTPIKTKKIRLKSNHIAHLLIRELRVYQPHHNYPDPKSETADTDIAGLVNLARDPKVKITTSGSKSGNEDPKQMIDGTTDNMWPSHKAGEKWVELTWPENQEVGHIQFLHGWFFNDEWKRLISEYTLQYHDGENWQDIKHYDVSKQYNLAEHFHTYGMEWTETEFKFYFDGKLIRTYPNEVCFSQSPIFFSLAVLPIAGEITDAINGTSMEVDYVRYYQRKSH